jgi:hypothetical protein
MRGNTNPKNFIAQRVESDGLLISLFNNAAGTQKNLGAFILEFTYVLFKIIF